MKTEKLMELGFVIPTREYNGGILGGLGLGVILTTVINSPDHRIMNPLVWLCSFGCIVVGSLLARAAQRKRFRDDLAHKKPDA
jgi:hypothetical protein